MSKPFAVDDMEVSFAEVLAAFAGVSFFAGGVREEATLWDSPATAEAMKEVFQTTEALCIEASADTGAGSAPLAYGFVLLPSDKPLPSAAQGVLGIDRVRRPRLIVIVAPDFREHGLGSALVNRLCQATADKGHHEVEVETERGLARFFEERVGFVQVSGAVREFITVKGSRRLYLYTKQLK